MKLRFTKMQGAGNDFVVLDATAAPIELSPAQARALGDRRFGVGADQILVVERSSAPGIDFGYRIYNNSGDEVEHCGNGARCFLKFVRARGITARDRVRVKTMNRVLDLQLRADGRVTVDMGAPVFDPAQLPFDIHALTPRAEGAGEWWPLALPGHGVVEVAVASMGNPHAVQRVTSVDDAAVGVIGPLVETHPRFAQQVNAGFVEVLSRTHVKLRVYERGAGETLACGTGACAAVACGIRLGWLDPVVDVDTRGGRLTIEWAGRHDPDAPVLMTGPAETVFEGEIEL